ncbi:type II secretion system F family protein [Nocardioides coralli]|uniref:type II secretion system F family protein n=1 Tax=Nocardioides coralli TaxID=2872154 RepID=UPI001CA3C78C|nr:type II secretion system F family protein [Nocardioides coralli]QZY29379.1 type II secretion system F family protein [Nocardioides coralli]
MTALVAGTATALAIWWALPPRPQPQAPLATRPDRRDTASGDWLHRGRHVWPVLAGAGVWTLVSGWTGLGGAVLAAVVVRHLVGSAEPAASRREREAVRRDLPVVVLLLGVALRGGAAIVPAIRQVGAALPGTAAARLGVACDRITVGVDPERVWRDLAGDPALAPLGRALARAHRSGAPVARAVERLADDLAATARAEVEDRARAVGVKAALPLGVCLLPAFLLLGIVPLVVSLVTGMTW